MFGKLMSISDARMWRYFELLSFRSLAEIEKLREQVAEGRNPRDVKFELADEITGRFHDAAAARAAKEAFQQQFGAGGLPDSMPEYCVAAGSGIPVANLLKEVSLTASTSEAHRMVGQGAVRIDGERVEDSRALLRAGGIHVIQVGKRRYARVSLEK